MSSITPALRFAGAFECEHLKMMQTYPAEGALYPALIFRSLGYYMVLRGLGLVYAVALHLLHHRDNYSVLRIELRTKELGICIPEIVTRVIDYNSKSNMIIGQYGSKSFLLSIICEYYVLGL